MEAWYLGTWLSLPYNNEYIKETKTCGKRRATIYLIWHQVQRASTIWLMQLYVIAIEKQMLCILIPAYNEWRAQTIGTH
jgi:hypothetical protein